MISSHTLPRDLVIFSPANEGNHICALDILKGSHIEPGWPSASPQVASMTYVWAVYGTVRSGHWVWGTPRTANLLYLVRATTHQVAGAQIEMRFALGSRFTDMTTL